ncbi:hypothetical protein ABZ682_22755 [Streptomyces griseoviridis]|uniref:hypothetical protein n=1 Tax=Streptomyces griseoviridis TaxID=45398 RepID=UPI0033EDEF9F
MTPTAEAEAPTVADDDAGVLPPYSAENAICPKCQFTSAFTHYRPAVPPVVILDWNGGPRRGPLPQRLERECERCSFCWDEALATAQAGMTVDALVYALHSSMPYPVELDLSVLEYMAFKLLAALHVTARPDNPLWKYSNGRPPVPVAPGDICEVPHETHAEDAACEDRRTSAAPASKETLR